MTTQQMDDIYYVCTMIEYVGRHTKNRRRDVVSRLGRKGIERQLKAASVNHALSFEQVSDEWIEDYEIPEGSFDSVSSCRYKIPAETAIGRVYQDLVLRTMKEGDAAQGILDVFSSFISDEISDFNTNVYYSNPDYLKCSYEEGVLLA